MEDQPDIEFKNNNPGAVRYGNFINYYEFHPVETRIKLFPNHLWNNLKGQQCNCLDVGCNSGDLTFALFDFCRNNITNDCKFLGIDIDPILITRANAKIDEKYQNSIEFKCIDIMKDYNILDKNLFNISFCLSITMWIHLNYGDDGLKEFLKTICNISQMVVVEPQPWKCYKTALKRFKQGGGDFPLFKQLKHRQDVEDYIENIIKNDCYFEKIYETPQTKWGRRILFYKKIDSK